MNRKKLVIALIAVANMAAVISVGRADFSFYWRDQNYLRFESRLYRSLDLNQNDRADTIGNDRVYSTFLLRMKPSMSLSDRLLIHSLFDAYVSPHTTKSQESGALVGQQATDNNNYGPSIGTLPRDVFGSSSGYGTSNLTSGDSNFLIKNLFMEYIGDWGILKVGRIPRHWGLGIRYNAGLNAEDKFSDRTDSLFYELGLGNFKVAAIASKILEGASLDTQADDTSLYEGYLNYIDPELDWNVGFLYSWMKQSRNFIELNILDGYITKKFKKLKTGLEFVTTFGDPGNTTENGVSQLGVAAEVEFEWTPALSTFLKLGYASGPDIDKNKTLTLFAFDRNYDIAFLMFNQGLGAISTQTGISANADPDVNAIFSAYYASLGGNYHFNDRIGSRFSLALAKSPKSLVAGGGKSWGEEVDLELWYKFLENWRFGLEGGVFFPGDLYEGASTQAQQTDPAMGALLQATVSF
ncbi:MAG: hypothetical protein HY390_07235 [Deltaproteobacteria bacterium]|nr:hypothetical protein [Deltaproteobacteria bacterium]